MARYDNILDTIGNTPLVKLQKLAPPGVNVYVKIESFNPMGSVKDRMARAIIERWPKILASSGASYCAFSALRWC
jgi:cysteine synthase A